MGRDYYKSEHADNARRVMDGVREIRDVRERASGRRGRGRVAHR